MTSNPVLPADDLPWIALDFLSDIARMRPIAEEILLRCRHAGFTDRDLFAIRLALEEALMNAVTHGNQQNPAKLVKVLYRILPDRVDISVEDEGPGFNPAQLPDSRAPENLTNAHGRGVHLIQVYMHPVTYNPKGNKITMTRLKNAPNPH